MKNQSNSIVKTIQVSKSIQVINQSVYGWFYEKGMSVKTLHNLVHNSLVIIVPNENFHLSIQLTGSKFKKEETLSKLYNNACLKFGIENIFKVN